MTFRSWRATVVALIPLVMTTIICKALMVWMGIGLKVATLPVIAVGVGVGVPRGVLAVGGADVIGRLLDPRPGPATLRRASYAGRVGHPVVLGRDHWVSIDDTARGDRGARDYLARHVVELVECGDLATGEDRDRPPG